MAMNKPKLPAPTATPTTPMQFQSPAGAGQNSALASSFSAFSFAPRLQAFAQNRAGRRSLIGGGS